MAWFPANLLHAERADAIDLLTVQEKKDESFENMVETSVPRDKKIVNKAHLGT